LVYMLDVRLKKQMAIAMMVVKAKKKLMAISAFSRASLEPSREREREKEKEKEKEGKMRKREIGG
jgi:hypothetical protein